MVTAAGRMGLVVALLGMAGAQVPYGIGTPGSQAFIPQLDCGHAWMGNGAFSLTASQGLGGAQAFLGISMAPASQFVGSTLLLVDPSPASGFLALPVTLGGTPLAPGLGSATIPMPLSFPVSLPLAGTHFYAQLVVDDVSAGVLSASRGLDVEVTLPPRVFVGTSVGGASDPAWLLDPVTQTVVEQFTIDGVTGAKFTEGGKSLFVAQAFPGRILRMDLTGATASTSVVYAPGPGLVCYGVAVDEARGVLYTAVGTAVASFVELYAVSFAGPTAGQVLGQTVGLSGTAFASEQFTLSRSGLLGVVTSTLPNSLHVVNTNPASPGFMTMRPPVSIPCIPNLSCLATRTLIDVSESVVMVMNFPLDPGLGVIARYDLTTLAWLDHNPSLPGIQGIGRNSAPVAQVPPGTSAFSLAPNGRFAVAAGFSGLMGRLELDPENPLAWSWTTLAPPVSVSGANTLDLSPDGAVAAMPRGLPNPQEIRLIDTATGALLGNVPLPGMIVNNGNFTIAAR